MPKKPPVVGILRPRRRKRRLLAVAVPPPAQQLPRERPGAPGGKRDGNRREKVQLLCDAALRLFLVHGIEGTRIDDITRAAGVAKGSFYRYFSDKQQLCEALFQPLHAATLAALDRADVAIATAGGERPLDDAYASLGGELNALVAGHAAPIRLFLQERRGPDEGARAPVARLARLLEERAEALTTCALDRGLLRPFPPRVSSLAVIGAVEELLHAFLSGRDVGDPSQIPALVTSLIMSGLRPSAPVAQN
jgi:AcrR family transcriptional regulator